MSYILEALKKAEHQRDIGRVPGIGSEHEPVVSAATGRWKWVLVAVLGFNAVLLTFVLWPRHPATGQNTAAVAVPTTSPVAPATARAASHASVPEPAPVDKQAVPAAPVAVVPPPTPAPAVALRPLPPLQKSVKSTPTTVHEAAKIVPAIPESAEADGKLPAPPVTARAAPRTSVREPAPSVKQAEPPTPVTVMAPPPTPATPLPQSVKSAPAVAHEAPAVVPPTPEPDEADANLPVWPSVSPDLFHAINSGLHLDVHVYSKVPQQRLVLINKHRYTEGQRLQEGPVVDAIRPYGVILSFRGQRFRLTAQ